MPAALDLPLIRFPDADAWSAWLAVNHAGAGVWLRLAKAGAPEPCLRYPAALDVALQWGWIDGQTHAIDDLEFRRRFTPRRRGSLWSKINTEKARALIASGRMKPPGLREVDLAKSDGRWDAAYSGSRGSTVPDDLAAALALNPAAGAFFASLDSANRFAVLWRLQTAKAPATRMKVLARMLGMLDRGERIHEPKPKLP